jgi:hypothetical protein
MAEVYLNDGGSIQVNLENLEDYLFENEDQIETRHHEVQRKPILEELTPDQIRAGTKTAMTHAQRQAFLINSELGKKLGFDTW